MLVWSLPLNGTLHLEFLAMEEVSTTATLSKWVEAGALPVIVALDTNSNLKLHF